MHGSHHRPAPQTAQFIRNCLQPFLDSTPPDQLPPSPTRLFCSYPPRFNTSSNCCLLPLRSSTPTRPPLDPWAAQTVPISWSILFRTLSAAAARHPLSPGSSSAYLGHPGTLSDQAPALPIWDSQAPFSDHTPALPIWDTQAPSKTTLPAPLPTPPIWDTLAPLTALTRSPAPAQSDQHLSRL